jgi:uncharacterized protein (TIGR03435 family)
MMNRIAIPLLMVMATASPAQTPVAGSKTEFEVASIRPAKQDGGHDSDTDKGRFTTHNLSLKRLIAMAYDTDINQVFGDADWVDSEGFDINARIPSGLANPTGDQVAQMIQSLLTDRFQLVFHREPRQVSGYALVTAKQGTKMMRAKESEIGSDMHSNNAHMAARYVTMEQLAKRLSRNQEIGKMVVDRTKLTGRFDFELDWMPVQLDSRADPLPGDRPSIFTALQEQLGLKLEAAKVPIQAIVVDRAERPDAN